MYKATIRNHYRRAGHAEKFVAGIVRRDDANRTYPVRVVPLDEYYATKRAPKRD